MMKKNLYTRILSLVALVSLLYSNSFAQTTVTLKAVKDNTIFSEGSKSNGAGSYLFVGKTEATVNGIRRALIQFDVASIPANATITDVKLQLTGSKAAAADIEARRVTTTWGEGSSDATGEEGGGATPGTNDATWTHSTFNTLTWTTPGGDFSATTSGTANVTSGSVSTWTGAGMVKDVQDWVA